MFSFSQVCSSSWKMLNNFLGNMAKIGLLTQQVSLHSASAANLISHGDDSEVIQLLPENLIPLKEMTSKGRRLCNDMESELETWFAMTSELLEASIETHSMSEGQRKLKKPTERFCLRYKQLPMRRLFLRTSWMVWKGKSFLHSVFHLVQTQITRTLGLLELFVHFL